jgi:tetratricopeptide (TPR) repeat protein
MNAAKRKSFLIWAVFLLFLSCSFSYLKGDAEKRHDKPYGTKQAFDLFDQGKRTEAIAMLREIAETSDRKESSVAYIHLGVMYMSGQDYDSAIKGFNKALDLDDKRFMAYYHLGLAYEAKTLNNVSEKEVTGYKRKALKAWNDFVKYADMYKLKDKSRVKKKKEGREKRRPKHMHACSSKYIDTAQEHIELLEEELGNE